MPIFPWKKSRWCGSLTTSDTTAGWNGGLFSAAVASGTMDMEAGIRGRPHTQTAQFCAREVCASCRLHRQRKTRWMAMPISWKKWFWGFRERNKKLLFLLNLSSTLSSKNRLLPNVHEHQGQQSCPQGKGEFWMQKPSLSWWMRGQEPASNCILSILQKSLTYYDY